ncbi:Acyl transferase domain-containing protein [Allokutzneria albata]|uniref:6-deoxyerythronolide-B synthase n=1 Tax=Allokutzneria albata TaxID=211114 RepID=A0A1H0BXX4_ALLAB|nr:type I polyketide synthase [Allokutzneria albata]SDN50529.1 Acyl transferase domain-containing protein [Allokutzneria albata]
MDNNEAKLRDYLKRATTDLRAVKRRLREVEDQASEPIAIVGMACRFPGGVRGPEDLWTAVAEGRDLMGPFPSDRGWDLDALYDPTGERRNSSYVNEGAFLDDVALFDAGFFGISPREALAMDPQQRLLLETAWEGFERAGIDPADLRGSQTGVYLGATDHDYGRGMTELPEELEGNVMIGRSGAISSGRIAYFLGLHGPAVTIDTMCSSSLVALHLACEGLRRGDCSMAVTGGTTVLSTPEGYTEFSRQGALAKDGRCKAFSAAADGTGWAEGVGVLIIERLSDARRNGHNVLAVVRGSAINQDGASNGLTAPNGTAQRKVIQQALANARVSADEVDAVEAHGTGTTLGDPIEAHALLATYGQKRETPLWLGSLKSNLGHAAAAAGVAGVIKMVLALQNGLLPKTLHVDEPSPKIDWSAGAVSLLTEAREWTRNGHPRRAGVSAFGASGTNAHVILEEAPAYDAASARAGRPGEGVPQGTVETPEFEEEPQVQEATKVSTGALPWVVSARTADALRAQARRLRSTVDGSVQDIGYSLAKTRSTFEHRAVVIGPDREDMLAGLDAVALGEERDGVVRGVAGDLGKSVFVFPGQGAQWAGMAVELLETSPVFAARIQECHDALAPFTDWSLLDVLRGDDTSWLERVDMVQPALWAVMVSLASLWRASGVEPSAVIGHSQGEIAAAVVAGALSIEDGARVVALRSKAIRAIAGVGGMMSVQLPREQALPYVTEGLSLAAVNGSGSVVISGDNAALDALQAKLEGEEVRVRRVPVDYASHSAHVEKIHAELLDVLGPITPKASEIPFYSTVLAEQIDTAAPDSAVDAEYWYRNLRQTVELEKTTKLLIEHGHDIFIEVSPHSVLLPALGETLDALGRDGATVGSLRRDQGGLDRFLASVAELHVRGGSVAWTSVFAGLDAAVVDLPTYAFQRRRYWLEAPEKQVEQAVSVDSGLDNDFWQAVEQGDVAALASTVGLDTDKPLSALLPDLAEWRTKRREQSIVDSWRYRVDWAPIDEPAPAKLDGTWLVLVPVDAGYDALRARVRAAVEQHGGKPVVLELAEGDTDRELLAKRLRDASGPFRGVLSLLALDQRWHVEHRGLPNGLAATLALIQALGDAEIDAPLWLITSGIDQVPAQAAAWGLGRVAALEFSQRWGGMVDVPQNLDEAAVNRLGGVLAGHGDEDQVSIRPSGIFARRLVRVASANVQATWKPQSCVLLTGGTGGVGAQIARWLAKHRARRLVLTSRRGIDAPGARELVAELAEYGTEAIVVACDVGDEQSLIKLKRRMEADGWPITSVMHIAGAGVLNGLSATDLDEFADTAYAKIAGAAVLDAVFDTDEVAEFILFSSISAVWGSGDHGAYAAANAYLDGLAESRRARGRPALSLVWGIWDPEEGGGMAANLVEQALRDRGIPFMNPRLAIDGFHRVLSDQNRAVEVVAEVDWSKFVPVFTAGRPSPLLETIPEVRAALQKEQAAAAKVSTGEASLKERLATMSPAERSLTIASVVRTQVAASLKYPGPESVETTRAFRELGFDSLTAVDLRNRLGEATGLRFPVTIVFDHPNVVELAKHVEKQLVPETSAAPVERNETLALLSSISLDRLREAGLLDTLLRLANGEDEEPESSDIDDMDVSALVAMALETDN